MTLHGGNEAARLTSDHDVPGLGALVLKRLLACLEVGRLSVVTPTGERLEYRAARPGIEAVLVLHRWRAIRCLVVGGDLGFAESYVEGDWSSPTLPPSRRIISVVGSIPPGKM